MNHLPVLPVLVPLLAGSLLVVLHRARAPVKRVLSLAGVLATAACVVLLAREVADGRVLAYLLGNWAAPFGITLAVDRLTVTMLALTAVLGLVAWSWASAGADQRGAHFHALLMFQVAGLNGAFLTADLFNLFVFFEVLLISSYGLMLHGGGAQRLRRGMHYVVFNLLASALFLIAVALLYGVLGSLNMADLAARIEAAPVADLPLVASAGLILMVVFAIKAALLPLYFWLPATYAASTPAVAALFAIMTKVGVYSLLRVYTLLFGDGAGALAGLAWEWLLPAGMLTMALAALGTLAAASLRRLTGYLVIASAGLMLLAFGHASAAAIGAGLYYLIHSTLAASLMFLVAELVRRGRGDAGDSLRRVGSVRPAAWIGILFGFAAVAAASMPPLAGFLGKALVLDAIGPADGGLALWVGVLVASLLIIIALARAGAQLFWRAGDATGPAAPTRALELAPAAVLAAGLAAATVFAGPLASWTRAAGEQIKSPLAYREAVLGTQPVVRAERTP
jgi:multicomponent K+:H+ antiporter subunit D